MDNNYYYNPEKYKMTNFGGVDGGGSYEFDMVCVWRLEEDQSLVWAADSGCSCPVPFDGVERRPLELGRSFEEFTQALDNCRADKAECRRLEDDVRYALGQRRNS